MKPRPETKSDTGCSLQRMVRRRREERALEALVALALRNDSEIVTDAEIAKYMLKPVKLSKADEAALKRARPKLVKALRAELRPEAMKVVAWM